MKKYLILGASGLLGERAFNLLPQSHGTFFKNRIGNNSNLSFLNLATLNDFKSLLQKIKPDVVINCTGLAKVDLCEKMPERSWKLNSWLPVKIAQECNSSSIKFVHISTDHFLNHDMFKLKESDTGLAINQYGLSKLWAEKYIQSINAKSIIIRANFFHFNLSLPKTFLDRLIAGVNKKKVFHSFSDVFFTPISTFQLVRYIDELVDLDFAGIINVASSEVLSKFDFHNAVLKAANAPSGFHFPTTLNNVELVAKRPKFMALDNNLIQKTLNIKLPSIYDMIKCELQMSK